jgi:predicted permease
MALDLRATLRGLRRRPAFSVTAIVTLSLGIGATTAVFSIVDAILLRPLPFAEPHRLVAIWPNRFLASREVAYLREHARSYDEIALFSPGWLMALTDVEVPQQLNAGRMSGNLFSMVGARPLLGRTFGLDAEQPANGRVAVLGWAVWQQAFGGDSTIIGRSIMLNSRPYEVLAVMPRGFQLFDQDSDMWMPMTMSPDDFTWTGATSFAYGRLRQGTALQQANAELPSLVRGAQAEFRHPDEWARGFSVIGLHDSLVGGVKRMLWLLFGAVVFLLLIATANVANLLLVRTSERRHELALRLSLGAPALRLARLLLSETVALGMAGGIAAIGIAMLGVRFIPGLLPADLPRVEEIMVDGRVMGFALVVTLLPSLVVALAPIAHALRTSTATRLRESRGGSPGGERTRGMLVAAEVAMALVLLVGASLMGRTMVALFNVDPGLRAERLLTARLQPSAANGEESVRAWWRALLTELETVPGVVSAATILHLPTIGRSWSTNVTFEGRTAAPGAAPDRAAWQSVSEGYFATAGIPLLAGRDFGPSDRAATPRVVIVNDAFASRYYRGESPLGKRITTSSTSDQPLTVIGVVGGVRHDSLNAPPVPEVYVPIEQVYVGSTSLVVRTSGDPLALAGAIRDRIRSMDRNVPITDMRTMDDLLSASLHRPRLLLTVISLFAGLGLLLGLVGIYGVVAYGVQQRVRELGIRAALGADAGRLNRLVVRGGLRYALIGIVVGVPAALALSRALRGFVFGVATTDPLSFTLVPIVLLLVALAACWIPARRASRSDPMEVLRTE